MAGVPVTLEIAAVTDIGQLRSSNQDNFYVNGCYIDRYGISAERFETVDSMNTHILAVCDGMGGQADGDVAAMMGVSALFDLSGKLMSAQTYSQAERAAHRILIETNNSILERSRQTGKKMGSTFSMLVISSEYLYACNLGDSEIFLKTRSGMERLSKPQTVAQQLVDMGAISEAQASRSYVRNHLSQYLGMENISALTPNESTAELHNGDILLICSDGVSDVLPNHSIYASLSSDRPVKDIADALIEKALRKGSGDNLTVVVARVTDDGREVKLRRRMAIALGIAAGAVALLALIFSLL